MKTDFFYIFEYFDIFLKILKFWYFFKILKLWIILKFLKFLNFLILKFWNLLSNEKKVQRLVQ